MGLARQDKRQECTAASLAYYMPDPAPDSIPASLHTSFWILSHSHSQAQVGGVLDQTPIIINRDQLLAHHIQLFQRQRVLWISDIANVLQGHR